jgi:hypothetical protein
MDNKTERKKFVVESFPKEKINLFEKNDFFIYEKKFYNDLPYNELIPPKSFQYASSNENFCLFDINTMFLGLRKSQEILTDPKINTNIHKDFIDNSLKLIFDYPGVVEEDETDYSKIKQDIINIIDEKDEADVLKDNMNKKSSTNPFYLRQSTIMGTTFGTGKKTVATTKKENVIKGISTETLKKEIENSFTKSERIQEGCKHPFKEGVVAKKIIDVVPFHPFIDKQFTEVIFNSDPRAELGNYSIKQFLLKNSQDDIYKFYKHDNNPHSSDITKPQYYNYEREYSLTKANENEIFNRFLLFKSNNDDRAYYAPITSKVSLKKHKKPVNPEDYDDQSEDKDIILIPKTYEDDSKMTAFIRNGFDVSIEKDNIEVSHEDIRNLAYAMRNKDVVMTPVEAEVEELEQEHGEELSVTDKVDEDNLFGSESEGN